MRFSLLTKISTTLIGLIPIILFIKFIQHPNYNTSYIFLWLTILVIIKIIYPIVHILIKGIFVENFKKHCRREFNELRLEFQALYLEFTIIIFFLVVLVDLGLADKVIDFLNNLTNSIKTISQNKL